ncbi:MAG: NUDIX hydrolase [Bacilli bacterium]|nr:NUDIX hydrolase [Bacilli bacterium]
MKRMNVIVVYDQNLEKILMCKRTKPPYMGLFNLVGGKIEKENDGLNEAYRELEEETNITKEDIVLTHFMNLTYITWNMELEVYYGILNKEVNLIEEVNKLEWVNNNDNFFDMTKYAGEGNIGHIIEELKFELKKKSN